MHRRPPVSTRTATPFPSTKLFRSLPISSGQPVNTSCNRSPASPPPDSKSSLSWPLVNQVVARICGVAIPMMDRRNVVEYEADSLILCSCYVLQNSTLPVLVKQSESGLSLPYRDISRISSHAAELTGSYFV